MTVFILRAPTQEIELEASRSPGGLEVSARLESASALEVFRSLDDGLEAEIVFQFRLYERSRGLLSFLGDRLVLESRPSHTARKDFFRSAYVLETSRGGRRVYDDPSAFIRDFFQLRAFRLPRFAPEHGKSYYLRGRVTLSHAKLVPPLNLIYIFFPVGVTTEWKETTPTEDGAHEAP